MSRVLVIGAGMAGTAAALAARSAGADVTVIGAGPGATAFSSGVVWSLDSTLPGRFDGFASVVVGAHVANVLGELRAVGQALAPQARGALSPGRKVGVVGLRGAPQLLDTEWAADGLRQAGFDAVPLELSIYLTAEETRRSPFEWATALDVAAEQARWGAGLARLPADRDLLLLPPFLGWESATLERVQTAAGRALGELAATTPSVPGLRLNRLLEARLRAAGCVLRRDEVKALAPGAATLKGGESVMFDGAVLATGRFLGGGLRRTPAFEEPVLGLRLLLDEGPVPAPGGSLETLMGNLPGAEAAGFRIGVAVDGAQHPLNAAGEPLKWLHAAGSLLAGADRGLGFAWASGTAAGRAAAGAREPVSLVGSGVA